MKMRKLLLVDDERSILDVLEDAFFEEGFEVFAASNGRRAITELQAEATQFAAIITDIRLGMGPDGWAVAQRARELASDISVIYLSGDSNPDWVSKGVPHSMFFTKPFGLYKVVTAVSMLLNEADARRAVMAR